MVIELSGVQFGLKSYAWFRNRTSAQREFCLLYTSDAADEEDSVDLGGRRIIKKKSDFKMDVIKW